MIVAFTQQFYKEKKCYQFKERKRANVCQLKLKLYSLFPMNLKTFTRLNVSFKAEIILRPPYVKLKMTIFNSYHRP